MQSYHFHRRRKCGGRQKLLSSQGPIRGGGCNRSDLGERIRSHWIRSPPAVCQSCQRPQWSKHKGYLKCPRTHVPAGGWSSFSLLAPPILAICPFAALPSCAFAALRPPFRRKTVSSSALPQRGGGLLRVDDKPFYSSSVSLRGRQPAWLTTAPTSAACTPGQMWWGRRRWLWGFFGGAVQRHRRHADQQTTNLMVSVCVGMRFSCFRFTLFFCLFAEGTSGTARCGEWSN